MKKSTQVVLAGVLFLSNIMASAQISTRTGGATNVLPNSPTTNTNVGIGTNTPKSKLDIKGGLTVGATYGGVNASPTNGAIIEGSVGIGTTNPSAKLEIEGFPTTNKTYNFLDISDSYAKSRLLNIGTIRAGTARLLTFHDVPPSNVSNGITRLALDDRNDANRLLHVSELNGFSMFVLSDKNQQEVMKINEEANGNVFMHFPKPNSRIVIAGFGDYLPEHKFVVRGSAKIEGNILTDANIGIGTANFVDGTDTFRLSVKGAIRADRVKVYTTWADFVFEKNYKLPTLEEVEKHIAEKGHLKDIPSAKEVEAKGIELGEMNKLLLQKVEELTLYMIELKKEVAVLKSKIE